MKSKKKIIIFLIAAGSLAYYFMNKSKIYDFEASLPTPIKYRVKHHNVAKDDYAPMVVAIHGNGADEKELETLFKEMDSKFRIIFLRAPDEFRRGFGWEVFEPEVVRKRGEEPVKLTPEQEKVKEAKRRDKISTNAESIHKAMPELLAKFKTTGKPIFLGFSAGAMMAGYIGMNYLGVTKNVIYLSGKVEPYQVPKTLKSAAKFYMFHGKDDEIIKYRDAQNFYKLLKSKGGQAEFFGYKSGHFPSKNTSKRSFELAG